MKSCQVVNDLSDLLNGGEKVRKLNSPKFMNWAVDTCKNGDKFCAKNVKISGRTI